MLISDAQSEFLLNLARRTIRQALGGVSHEVIPPEDPALLAPAGCFCSLHTQGTHMLRGCVGIVTSRSPLYRTVISASELVLEDSRFKHRPVRLAELRDLDIELSVLSAMTRAASPQDFDLLNDGIYLTIENASGLFLPQVARETGWPKETLLARLCTEKLGVSEHAWREPNAILQKFTVQILGPAPVCPAAF